MFVYQRVLHTILVWPWIQCFRKPLMIRDVGRYWFTTYSFKMVRFGWWSRSQPLKISTCHCWRKDRLTDLNRNHVFNFIKTQIWKRSWSLKSSNPLALMHRRPASHHVWPKVGFSGDNPLDIGIFCCRDWDLLGKHRWFCHWCPFQRVATSCWDWDPCTHRAIWKPFADDWWEL